MWISETEIALRANNRKTTYRFIKGPIPLEWIYKAARLGGKSLNVGIAIWYRVGLEKKNKIKLNLSRLGDFGVKRGAAAKHLKSLEVAKLVSVTRKTGTVAIVEVLFNPHPTINRSNKNGHH